MCLSLVNLCLDTIVDHFPRYNLEFHTTKDELTKRKFEFLQKRYSYELLTKICIKRESLKDFIDLLINKYLKIIDITWFKDCSWEKVTSKIAEIGPNVDKIIFQDVYFEESCEENPWQDIICCLPNLKSFTFHDDCNDLILKNVAKFCACIEEIDIENSVFIHEAIKHLCKDENGKALCTKLKKICIAGTPMNDEGVKYLLKNLPSLEVIDYPNLPDVLYSLHKNDLSSLDKVEPYNIVALDLINFAHSPFFVDILKVCLSICPYLKSLTCGLLSKNELNFFYSLCNLEKLHIENFSDTEININDLLKSKGEKLTSLTVVNCTVSVSVLAESCPRINELILNSTEILFNGESKPVFSSLSSITFEKCGVSKNAMTINSFLSSSAKLESLSFKCCDLLSPEIKAHILKCCELYPIKIISFYYSKIGKEYLKDLLLNCHTLIYLNIEGCFENVDDEDELVRFAEILPNKPEIDASGHLELSDDEYLNGNYELDDDFYDYDYEDYDGDYDYDYDYEFDDDSDENDN